MSRSSRRVRGCCRNEGGASLLEMLYDLGEDGRPYRAADMPQVFNRRLHTQLCAPNEPAIDDADRARRPLSVGRAATPEKACDLVERPLRRRQTNALDGATHEVLKPFQGQREVGAALAPRDRVNLVEDHGAYGAEHAATAHRGEHDVQRFGRSDQYVGRLSHHARPRGLWRIARANIDPDIWTTFPLLLRIAREGRERRVEVALDCRC